MGTVGKIDLAKAVATETGMTAVAAQKALDALINVISERTAAGDTVRLTGFGSFQVKAHKARTARNPRTGEMVEVPETTRMHFKAAKTS